MIIVMCSVVWLAFGVVGYMLMRQGSLVDYEQSLGKKRAWSGANAFLGILGCLYGPVFILMAVKIYGRSCVKKRNEQTESRTL